MKNVVVFCGSSSGTEKIFEESAYKLGEALAKNGIGLVYGGAKVGLMGAVANGAIEHGGSTIGVLPGFLKKVEIAHEELSELIVVETMHERKKKMDELSDGIITLPGGYGTLEEFFEMLTWAQLGLHKKPVAILNINGFYNDLLQLLKSMVHNGFLKQVNFDMLLVSDNIEDLLQQMNNYQAPSIGKWISKDEV